jgi:beta-N-acetylhexosaminidase
MKLAVAAVATTLVAVTACSSGKSAISVYPSTSAPTPTSSAPSPITSSPRPPTSTSPPRRQPPPTAPRSAAQRTWLAMDEPQRVGQLFMVGASSNGSDQATTSAIARYGVGSVILTDTSQRSTTAVAAVSRQLEQINPSGAKLFVATDQEGGEVQRLQGSGFDSIPPGTAQGTFGPAQLRADARRWGGQLRTAGVNLDLAPVVDTVPRGATNPPIGGLSRQFGSDPTVVATHGVAFAQGLADAGVDATIKHFPGLGRVTANTDTASAVTDSITTRHDAYLAPFAAGIKAGAAFVMVSTAYYTRIDPDHPAAFSPTVVTGMLRGDLGFRGVVISDDVGGAAQVAKYSPGTRAVDFIAAGGDVLLTVNAAQIPQMTAAVLARARTSPKFRAEVDAAALRVLQAKQARGLLGG